MSTRNLRNTIARWESMAIGCVLANPRALSAYVNTFIVPKYLRRYGHRWLLRKIARQSPFLFLAVMSPETLTDIGERRPPGGKMYASDVRMRADGCVEIGVAHLYPVSFVRIPMSVNGEGVVAIADQRERS